VPSDRRQRLALLLLAIVLVGVFLAAIRIGVVPIPWDKILLALTGRGDELSLSDRTVILNIRLTRAVAAGAVGAVLGVCGAAMQGLFRNPLADPGLVGVSSGASLGGVLYMKFAATSLAGFSLLLGNFALPVCAFTGSLLVTWIIHRAALVEGRTIIVMMLLAGIAINALAGAAIGLALFFSDDDQLRQFTFWTLGNVGHATWPKLLAASPFFLAALFFIPRHARALNAFLLGEAEAGHLGIDLQRTKRLLIFITAAGVGAAVSVAGGIGFIGLVVPHLVRQFIGPDHRWLIPGAALLGAILLIAADIFARTLAAPAELPVGIITATLGAPIFFSLLQSQRKSLL
jgi:iron complex transport system permease protein